MSGIKSRLRTTLASAREILGVHLRTLIPVGVIVVVGLLVVFLLAIAYAGIIGVTAYTDLVKSIDSVETWTSAAALIIAPLLLLALLAALIWAGVVSQAASSAYDKKKSGMPTAVWRALRRAPKAAAIVIVTLGAALGAIIAAPVFLIVGIAGLITKRGNRERLIPMAIPFGVAILVLVRWSLALPALWIDGYGIRAALKESSRRVRGRGLQVAVLILAALLVSAGISEGLSALVPDPSIQLGVRIGSLLLFGALPLVTQTVLYRRGSDERRAPLPAPMTHRARVAVAVALSLVIPMSIGAVSAPAPANADVGTTVTMTTYFPESLNDIDTPFVIDVVGVAPTGTVTIEAIAPGGASIDLGTQPIDAAGHLDAFVGAGLAAGQYQLIAHYSGDGANAPTASTPLDHTFLDRAAAMSVISTPGATGDTATITVTLTAVAPAAGTPAGTVTITGGGQTWGPLPVDGVGQASVVVNLAGLSTRELLVTYDGDGAFVPGAQIYPVPRIPTALHVAGGPVVLNDEYGTPELFSGTVTTTTGTVPTGQVQLFWNGAVTNTVNLVGGAFSISTDELGVGTGPLYVGYLGDASHAPSDNSASPISLTVTQVRPTQAITFSPNPLSIGDNASLISTLSLAGLGAGPTGTVTFTTSTGTNIGTVNVVNGVATQPWVPTALSSFVIATYSGDHNFIGSATSVVQVDAGPAPVTVTITDPGPVTFGDVFTLTATVKVGATGLPPTRTLDFVTPTGLLLKGSVPVNSSGIATAEFCARSTGCPAGTVMLGAADRDIVAQYGGSATLLLGQATYQYRPSSGPTTTTLVVTPAPTIVYGSGVHLEATVTSPSGVTPTGTVAFYSDGPNGLAFIQMVTLTDGVARLDTPSGGPTILLRWPQSAIKAEYDPDGALFQRSVATPVAIELGRIATSVSINPVTPTVGTATSVTATLDHDPGASADYDGDLTITSDTGETCTRRVLAGQRGVTCTFTWAVAGAHSLTTSYAGDSVYLPAAAAVTPVTIGVVVGTPVLGITAPSSALVGENVTTTWGLTDPSMTGNVTVWGDGNVFCVVPVATQTCTGQFGNASATGGFVDIRVRYDGDANWHGVEEIRHITVTRCVILDVRGNDSTLGSVRVDTTPNCGPTGYLPGTSVQVTALPTSPGEFGYWLGYRPPAPNLVLVASSATTTFTVSNDTQTWVRVAQFRLPCSPVTAFAQGNGGIIVSPASNCVTDSGDRGWLYGTKVTITPEGHYNPAYDEPDGFWAFGVLPTGATKGTDRFDRPLVTLTVTKAVTIPVYFGPVCRTATVLFDPATEGDKVDYDLTSNCSSPAGSGYLRYTTVKAHAVSGDPSLAITGWSVNGTPEPELGTSSDLSIEIDQASPVYTASTVHCYSVDVSIDGVTDRYGEPTAKVRVEGTDCPDGSERFLAGTPVTLTPQVLVKGILFNGYDDTRIAPLAPDNGATGDVTAGVFVIPQVFGNYEISAGFFDPSACSRLVDVGTPGLLSFDGTGCGPGYYLDARKQTANLDGTPIDELTSQKTYSNLNANVYQDGPLGVYVSIKGDTPTCEGPLDSQAFHNIGLVTQTSLDCRASGEVQFWADYCQPVVTHPEFTVAGREGTYGEESMPSTFYLTGPDGVVNEVNGYQWGQAMPVKQVTGGYQPIAEPTGPCAATTNLLAPDTTILLYASAPSSGFKFLGWTGFGGTKPEGPSPLARSTNAYQSSLDTGVAYEVTCHTITLAEGLHIEGAAPRCPGTSESDNSYLTGTSIKIRANYILGGKTIEKFTAGTVGDQIYEDPATFDLITYVYVDQDKKVTALWQNDTQRLGTEIAKGLKFAAAIVAIVAPVIIGLLFPPVGIFFGVLGAMAGLTSFIPGGDKVSAVFDLVNPTKITECIGRWGFNTAGAAGGHNYGAIGKTAKTAATAVFTTKNVLVANIGAVGVAGAAASIGYGLYSSGILNSDLVGPQSVEELADRSTITGCLDQQWRIVGSNISGTNGSSPAGVVEEQGSGG